MPRPLPALCRLAAAPDPPAGDAQLLRAFLASRSDPAFAELVRRHGPMVFAVCRRVLGHTQDAEDAFQAAFLVLARKAGSVRGTNLPGWLYGVAVRTARGVRTMRDRRRKHSTRGQGPGVRGQTEGPCSDAALSPDSCLLSTELAAILDEELARLPDHYRVPVVLCELRGRSRKEAAAELGIPEGTLSSRLAAAKRKLAGRLTDRGYATTVAALTATLAAEAGASVPAGWSLAAVKAAGGQVMSTAASRAADGVVKALFVAQLKGLTVAVGLVAGLACAGVVLTGGPQPAAQGASDPEPAPPPRPVADAAELVKQLGSADFAVREDTAKRLRAIGPKALPALEAGTRDPNPEVARRSREIITAVRADALTDLTKWFDPAGTADHDHPVWQRFKAIAGDSRASRALFARIIANRKWLQTLDNAEADPARAGHVYRVGVAEIFRDFHNDPAKSPPWPCDRPEEVAYLLLLGSHPDPNPPAKLTGDEVVPPNLRDTAYLGRGIIRGEGQITHARGLELGLEGKWLVWQTSPAVAGTDRVFARLFAAWLERRDPGSEVVPTALRRGLMYRVPEVLPVARRYAANDFRPKREIPPIATIAALELVAQLGTAADLPLFERHFGDETNVTAVDPPRTDGARDYYRPQPVSDTTQMRDVALGLALLLHGANPADFGFLVRKDTFQPKDGRYAIPWTTQLHLGFKTDEDRAAAFKKAKEWLAAQKQPDPPKEDREPTAGLLKDLDDLDRMRQGQQTNFAAVEKRGEELLAKYPDRDDQALIYFTLTRVYSNSGIDRTWARVQKYGRLALEREKDPVRRGLIYSDLASAAEVAASSPDPLAADPFPVRRRRAAAVVLEGYRELLPLKLPDVAPELPAVEKIGRLDDPDPVEQAKRRAQQAAQMKARRDAVFVRDMVHRRDTYARQLRYLYGREPRDDAELRQLVTDTLKDPKAAADLLDRVWEKAKKPETPGGEPIRSFVAPAGVGAVAFDAKTGDLFVGSADLSVQVWDPTTGRQVRTFRVGAEGSTGAFHGLEVSPDGKRIAVRYFLAEPTGKFLVGFEGHVADVARIRFDRAGKRIATASFDGTVRLWEADTGKLLKTIEAHMGRKVPAGPQNGFGPPPGMMGGETGPRPGSGPPPGPGGGQPPPDFIVGRGAWDVAFSPDGKRVVSGGVDGAIRVWDAESGKEVWGGQVSEALMAVAYLPDGKRVISGEQEGNIRVWDVDTGKEVMRLTGHTSAVAALAVSPDGKRLASAGHDKTVRVWDVESGKELRCFRGHTHWVYAVAVSPDGRTVASGGEDRAVRLWAMP